MMGYFRLMDIGRIIHITNNKATTHNNNLAAEIKNPDY